MRPLPALALLLAACGCNGSPEPDALAERLRALPVVGQVETFGNGKRSLVHIAHYHTVPMEDFRIELPEHVTDAERLYEDCLGTVDAVQVKVLRALGVRSAWMEGLTGRGHSREGSRPCGSI